MSFSEWKQNASDLTGRVRRLENSVPKLRRAVPVYSPGGYTTPGKSAVLSSGKLNPLQAVQAKGNLSPYVVSGVLGFTATSNGLTIYWDGTNSSQPLVLKRADGTSFSVPSGVQSVSGLLANTKYGFAPYWSVQNSGGLSFAAGDSGTPRIAISPSATSTVINEALQQQQALNAEPIYSDLVYFTTTASGASSGPATTKGGNPISTVRVRGLIQAS